MLIDSGSGVNFTLDWCAANVRDNGKPVRVSAIQQQFVVRHEGDVTLLLPRESARQRGDAQATQPVLFPCHVLPSIGPTELGIDVLLSAGVGFTLGYLATPPSRSQTKRWKLPKLIWKEERSARRAGGARTTALRRPPRAHLGKQARRDHARRSEKRVTNRLRARLDDALVAMADATLGEILKTKKFPLKGEVCHSKADITWGETNTAHTAEQRAAMETLVDEYSDVFLTEALPPPCKHEPVDIPLKDPGARLPFEKPRHWRPHEKEYLMRAREQLESFGWVEKTTQPEGASRITLAEKDGGAAARLCIDLRRVNTLLKDFTCLWKDGVQQVERVSNSSHRFRSSFDLASAYSQIPVRKASQRLLTVILPDKDGVPTAYSYTRLPFGLKSSGAYLQRHLEDAFADLPEDLKDEGLYFYVDDVVITSATWADHIRHVRAFLAVCRERGFSLSYAKAQLLVREVTFFGFRCSPDGVTLTDTNTKALRAMPYPTTVSETRHVVGVFSVARRFVERFAHHVEPLLRLTRKGVPWRFGPAERAAFDHVRDALIDDVRLYAFDPALPLVMHTDASGTAEAAWLAQTDAEGHVRTIAFYSKSFSQTMRRQGATAREAHAVVFGLHAARVYCHSSPFETTVFTDCRSLTFVKDSTRSELSSRFLEKLQDIRYKLRYKRGVENTVADAFSRLDLYGPDELSPAGTATALDDLLEHLDGTHVHSARDVWTYMSEFTDTAYRCVQAWRGRAGARSKMSKAAPSEHVLNQRHDLRILRFDPHVAVDLARKVLVQPIPTAILLPLDLTGQIGADTKGNPIPNVLRAVRACKKRVYAGGNQIWLLSHVDGAEDDVCLAATLTAESPDTDPLTPPNQAAQTVEIVNPVPLDALPEGTFHAHEHYGETRHLLERLASDIDVTSWPEQQTLNGLTEAERERAVTDSRGLRWLRDDRGPDKLIVPPRSRPLILQLAHAESNHASAAALAREVRRNYAWPGMKGDCERWVAACDACALGNVRRTLHHNLYASSSYTSPRQVLGLDFKLIKVGSDSSQLLLMVDRFSSFATIAVLPDRTAASVIRALDHEYFSIFGSPRRITIDGAPEFRSAALRQWLTARGCELVPPMEFYPDAAGATERVWVMVRAAMRRLRDFSAWRAELRQAVFQYNALNRADGRPSPFRLFFGGEPNTLASLTAASARRRTDDESAAERIQLQGAEAVRQLAAADGDLTRRARAVKLNKSGRTPPTFRVGDNVWFWQDVSGGVNRGDNRPRSCVTPWQAGVVTAIDGPRHTIRPLTTGRGRRKAHERHPSRLKPRGTRMPGPATVLRPAAPAQGGAQPRHGTAGATVTATTPAPTPARPARARRGHRQPTAQTAAPPRPKRTRRPNPHHDA